MESAEAKDRCRSSSAPFTTARFVVAGLTTTGSMPCITTGSAASGPVTHPSQRPGHQFLGSRRPAFTREAPGRGNLLYTQALQLARQQDQEAAARTAFEICCTTHPDHTKVLSLPSSIVQLTFQSRSTCERQLTLKSLSQAWVSWAQFEKRVKKDQQERFHSCRQVLQQGLSINRTSAALIQVYRPCLTLPPRAAVVLYCCVVRP